MDSYNDNIVSFKELSVHINAIRNSYDTSIILNTLSEMKKNLLELTSSRYIEESSLEYKIMNDYILNFITIVEKPSKSTSDIFDLYYIYEQSMNTFKSIKSLNKKDCR